MFFVPRYAWSLAFSLLVLFVWNDVASAAAPAAPARGPAATTAAVSDWRHALDDRVLDFYEDPDSFANAALLPLVCDGWCAPAKLVALDATKDGGPFPLRVGYARAREQQALVIEMGVAVRAGDVEQAKAIRAELDLPRGVSAAEGALTLEALKGDKRDDAARLLVREAINWQSTRARVLLDDALRSTHVADVPLRGRLLERLGEAAALADPPASLRESAGMAPESGTASASGIVPVDRMTAAAADTWGPPATASVDSIRRAVEAALPNLLTDKERERRERLLLKLVQLIPKEYASGVRDGAITVPLEYREAVTFTQQARQIVGELAPLWLAKDADRLREPVARLDAQLEKADGLIESKAAGREINSTLAEADSLLQDTFGVSLRRSGTTADIVEEVMLETRTSLSNSLSQAIAGNWDEAERLRVEAYTTYDPELEARLLPRDPQLAMDIERLLLDGIDKPGVKVLLDRRASAAELTEAYTNVYDALERATVMLRTGVSPTAAAMNASSIVMREGLEGLLVIVAIFAGLRGPANARCRRLVWVGIAASMAATALTWLLSRTLITNLRNYGEIIEAVTGVLAIAVLLLITNWLFHQVYWRQWVTTLKAQAGEHSNAWQLITVGFLIGYREGFETVLFLQSLMLDAGGKPVALGVAVGCTVLILLGVAALRVGMKLPYFRILLVTALMIGVVLITFVGGTTRAAQTVGWLPVHKLLPGSWPIWMGSWLGLYNTWESIGAQFLTVAIVIGTWRVARWRAKAKSAAKRRTLNVAASNCESAEAQMPISGCNPSECTSVQEEQLVTIGVPPVAAPVAAAPPMRPVRERVELSPQLEEEETAATTVSA